MTHTRALSLYLNLVLIFVLTACAAGQIQAPSAAQSIVAPLSLYGTLTGLRSVVQSAPGTFVMENDQLIMLAWPAGANYAFAIFSKTGRPVCDLFDLLTRMGYAGNKTDVFTMSGLVKWAEASGWKYILPAALPKTILAALQSYTISAVSAGAQSLPEILLFPIVPAAFPVHTPVSQ
jgi:hypothetical protein